MSPVHDSRLHSITASYSLPACPQQKVYTYIRFNSPLSKKKKKASISPDVCPEQERYDTPFVTHATRTIHPTTYPHPYYPVKPPPTSNRTQRRRGWTKNGDSRLPGHQNIQYFLPLRKAYSANNPPSPPPPPTLLSPTSPRPAILLQRLVSSRDPTPKSPPLVQYCQDQTRETGTGIRET